MLDNFWLLNITSNVHYHGIHSFIQQILTDIPNLILSTKYIALKKVNENLCLPRVYKLVGEIETRQMSGGNGSTFLNDAK